MAADPSLSPDLIAARAFTSGFRGYDQSEVRDFLGRVAAEVRALRERADRLESAWHSAEERAARPPVLDEETLIAAVGEETASVLRAARTAASDLRSKAAQDAELTVADAQHRATEIRTEAEAVLVRETKSAEEAAMRVLEAARSDAAEMVDKARAEADSVRAAAQQERNLTIEGAIATRERVLDDLSRRRRVASVQIEQLRAGRERLLESYGVVRRTLEEVNDELNRADAEARAAADEVGRRMQREHHPELSEPAGVGAGAEAASPIEGSSAGGPAAEIGGAEIGGAEHGDAEHGDAGTDGLPPGQAGSGQDSPAVAAVAPVGPVAPVAPVATEPGSSPHRVPPAQASALIPPGGATRGGGEAGAAGAEALAAVVDPSRDPGHLAEPAPGPRLRVVPDDDLAGGGADSQVPLTSAGGPDPVPGSQVDVLFARIRAGRAEMPPHPAGASGEPGPALLPAAIAPTPVATQRPTNEARTVHGSAEAETTGPDGVLLARRQAVLADLESSLTRKLKRALQDEQNDLLDRLRSFRGEPTVVRLLPGVSEQITHYADVAKPLLDQAAAGGVAFAVAVLDDRTATPVNAPVVDDLAADAATTIVESLRRRLEHAISTSLGDEPQVLIEAVGSAYREWKSERIERIAGDVLAGAFSRGTWDPVPELGPLRWVVKDTDGPCPDCDDDALAGSLPKGEPFPTGQPYPPAHPGCRCLLVPVTE